MSAKQELLQLIEQLDEDAAAEALDYVRVLVGEQSSPSVRDSDILDEAEGEDSVLARARPFTFDDPLWHIVGIGDSGPDGPTDVARNTHKYLAEAYADRDPA